MLDAVKLGMVTSAIIVVFAAVLVVPGVKVPVVEWYHKRATVAAVDETDFSRTV